LFVFEKRWNAETKNLVTVETVVEMVEEVEAAMATTIMPAKTKRKRKPLLLLLEL
jgi:hypothetical protein